MRSDGRRASECPFCGAYSMRLFTGTVYRCSRVSEHIWTRESS